ncbi:hypothetical protein N8Z46_06075, partial [Amylibacter sp.]|nr:hypothetical protein [Amylibacter sp.]
MTDLKTRAWQRMLSGRRLDLLNPDLLIAFDAIIASPIDNIVINNWRSARGSKYGASGSTVIANNCSVICEVGKIVSPIVFNVGTCPKGFSSKILSLKGQSNSTVSTGNSQSIIKVRHRRENGDP